MVRAHVDCSGQIEAPAVARSICKSVAYSGYATCTLQTQTCEYAHHILHAVVGGHAYVHVHVYTFRCLVWRSFGLCVRDWARMPAYITNYKMCSCACASVLLCEPLRMRMGLQLCVHV